VIADYMLSSKTFPW